jgi:hypothetical protein
MEVKAKLEYIEKEIGMRKQTIWIPLRKGWEIKHHAIECSIRMKIMSIQDLVLC